MNNTDSTTTSTITSSDLPAILIGGPPNAGKSVLTYNLTRALRENDIPHYVFRANPDGEGDWFLKGDPDTVRQIRKDAKSAWSETFRAFVCRDLAQRPLPLIVDLGGRPSDADSCIFQVCTHSILLLKDDDEAATQTWRRYAETNHLKPLAELRSQLKGESILTADDPLMGIITKLERGTRIHTKVFTKLLQQVTACLSKYQPDELKKFHLDEAPSGAVIVNLPDRLRELAPDVGEDGQWTPNLLQPLLNTLSTQTTMAVYGSAPVWVYSALALHAAPQPFHQFDARLGWITPPSLQASRDVISPQSTILLKKDEQGDAFILRVKPIHGYLDLSESDQLLFPELPSQHGVIITGKLPQWLFTSLARFYAQRNVPWIAVNDAHNNRPIVIYSQIATRTIGEILPALI